MANPNWKPGAPSPNPEGRRKTKHSVRTPKGMIENFIKRNLSQRQLQRMYDELDSKDQFKVLTELLPYVMPKQSSLTADLNIDNLNDRDLDALYEKVTQNITYEMIPAIPLPEMSDEEIKRKLDEYARKEGYIKPSDATKLIDNQSIAR